MILMSGKKFDTIQLTEFDINQKIMESLCSVCTRAVLFSIKGSPRDATWIAENLKISLSTVYKALSVLEDLTLIEVDKYVISPEGKKVKQYRSRISRIEITMDDISPNLNLYPNTTLYSPDE